MGNHSKPLAALTRGTMVPMEPTTPRQKAKGCFRVEGPRAAVEAFDVNCCNMDLWKILWFLDFDNLSQLL